MHEETLGQNNDAGLSMVLKYEVNTTLQQSTLYH